MQIMVSVQDLGKCRASKGASYTILFRILPEVFKVAGNEASWSSNTPSILTDSWGFDDWAFWIFSAMAGLIVDGEAFHAVLYNL